MTTLLLKVEGAGNDFLLGTGDWAHRLAEDVGLVVRLCDRRRGVGADGALAVFGRDGGSIRLVHLNADGSRSAFCANGTRCAARAAVARVGLPPRLTVLTDWAEIAAHVQQDTVTLELPPLAEPIKRSLETGGRCWQGSQIVVGVPHLVLPVSDLDDLAIDTVAPPLRRHPTLGPEGANVHFVERGAGALRIRSFERGVEAETLCCGSGVVAAGLLALMDGDETTVSVQARSGDRLTVETLGTPPGAPSRLTGPVRLVAEIDPLD